MIPHEVPYRVDGEAGRFTFTTHGIRQGTTVCHQTGRWFFPPLQGKEWYRTRGFKELALVHGVVEGSYRKTTDLINRVRHQSEEEGTPPRTLCDTSESEGQQVLFQMDRCADQILKAHHFTPQGVPPEACEYGTGSTVLSEKAIEEARAACDVSDKLKEEMAANPVPYEAPSSQVYVALDPVGVKRQKAQRCKEAPKERKRKEKKQYAYTTIAHVEHDEACYVLAGKGGVEVLRWLVALLLHNGLGAEGLTFLMDGQKTLISSILHRFSWWGSLQLILDWYHLEKKCKELLSRALTGREVRNATLQPLCHLLWHGLTDRAMTLVQQLEAEKVKNEEAQHELIAYLARCKPYIPCYAVRKPLGLPNGSSIGEKMNDLVVSDRQKHQGMSWSSEGSVALAALTALIRNQEHSIWFKKKTVDLKLKWAA